MVLIILFIIWLINRGKDDATIVAKTIEKFPRYRQAGPELRGGEGDMLKLVRQLRKRLEAE